MHVRARCRDRLRPVAAQAAPRAAATRGQIGTTALERGDEPFYALVARFERILAKHRALSLVIELQVHPVDGVIALAFLRALDEGAAEARAGRLRRRADGEIDLLVG